MTLDNWYICHLEGTVDGPTSLCGYIDGDFVEYLDYVIVINDAHVLKNGEDVIIRLGKPLNDW